MADIAASGRIEGRSNRSQTQDAVLDQFRAAHLPVDQNGGEPIVTIASKEDLDRLLETDVAKNVVGFVRNVVMPDGITFRIADEQRGELAFKLGEGMKKGEVDDELARAYIDGFSRTRFGQSDWLKERLFKSFQAGLNGGSLPVFERPAAVVGGAGGGAR